MTEILTVAEMRSSDAAAIAAGTPGRELMRRAGEGIFRSAAWRAPVAVVCGTGNNAGDGYVLAELLDRAGRSPIVVPPSFSQKAPASICSPPCCSI